MAFGVIPAHSPSQRPVPRRSVAKTKGEDYLAVLVLVACGNEADLSVERLRTPLPDDMAGQKLGCSVVTRDVGHELHRFTAISATLISLVD